MSKKIIIEDDDGKLIDLHPTNSKPKVVTEDLGKIFEMAICLLYETPYDGKFKYSLEKAEVLKQKIQNLKILFPHKLLHSAKNGARYDFTGQDDNNVKLSAKTTKNKSGLKVCPQVIGQPSKKKFCEFFKIDLNITIPEIKTYITENIKNMLKVYFEHTFDCPIIFYNEATNVLYFIKKVNDIEWENCNIEFGNIKKNKDWNESTSIYINDYSIGEFQVHNHRDNIKFRWNLCNLLHYFHDGQKNKYFEITNVHNLEKVV
jgi:hypothetical protein